MRNIIILFTIIYLANASTCPDKFEEVEGNCYTISPKMRLSSAKSFCSKMKAVVHDPVKNTKIMEHFSKYKEIWTRAGVGKNRMFRFRNGRGSVVTNPGGKRLKSGKTNNKKCMVWSNQRRKFLREKCKARNKAICEITKDQVMIPPDQDVPESNPLLFFKTESSNGNSISYKFTEIPFHGNGSQCEGNLPLFTTQLDSRYIRAAVINDKLTICPNDGFGSWCYYYDKEGNNWMRGPALSTARENMVSSKLNEMAWMLMGGESIKGTIFFYDGEAFEERPNELDNEDFRGTIRLARFNDTHAVVANVLDSSTNSKLYLYNSISKKYSSLPFPAVPFSGITFGSVVYPNGTQTILAIGTKVDSQGFRNEISFAFDMETRKWNKGKLMPHGTYERISIESSISYNGGFFLTSPTNGFIVYYDPMLDDWRIIKKDLLKMPQNVKLEPLALVPRELINCDEIISTN